MDNQFYPPNGGFPQGGQPGGMQPGTVYDAYGQPVAGYGVQGQQPAPGADPAQQPVQGYGAPVQMGQNPYGAQPGYAPYSQQPMGQQTPQDAYQQGYQQPYGGVQEPYAEAGYQYHFDHSQSVMQGPAGFQQPTPAKPPRPRLKLTPFHVAVIVAALGFLGWYLYASFAPEAAKYGQITSGSLSANHSGDCLIVRNEVPYDAEGVTSIAYDAQEGSGVNRGDNICKVYSSGYSTREMNTLQSYRTSIRDYQKKLIEAETTYDAKLTRVTTDVMNAVRAVRDLIGGSRGSLENQEEILGAAVTKRQDYLKSKYAADQRFSRLFDDETSQTQRIQSWTKQFTANSSGLVSFYSDGYEYSLTGSNYMAYEPRQVRAMINGSAPGKTTAQKSKTTIYRLVEDGEWYVLFLSKKTDWNPVTGQIYQLQLERFEDAAVYAEVESFTRSGGELLVRLRVPGSVEPVLYMRSCGAVLGENVSTLCVPERAILTQDGMTGVVMVNGSTESFIPVNVLHYDNGNAYFQAIQQGLLFEGMTVLLF